MIGCVAAADGIPADVSQSRLFWAPRSAGPILLPFLKRIEVLWPVTPTVLSLACSVHIFNSKSPGGLSTVSRSRGWRQGHFQWAESARSRIAEPFESGLEVATKGSEKFAPGADKPRSTRVVL